MATTFDDIQKIQISDDPITGLQRFVNVSSFYCGLQDSFFRLDCKVSRFKDGLDVTSDKLPMYVISLVADNTDLVDMDGTLDPVNGVIGQFDFFKMAAATPILLYDIFLQKVLIADSTQKFD